MTIPVLWLFVHFIADFVLQSDWMAINKSKRWDALAVHCLVYAACWLWLDPRFVALTFALHFVTDAVTSRITSYLWKREQRHWFFVVIGFDQVLHYVALAATGRYLGII